MRRGRCVIPARLRARLRKYGLTPEQYAVLKAMKKGCHVCGKVKRKDGKLLTLFIEHDHGSGRVRGLACYRCNRYLIGRHRKGTLLRAAADYIDSTFDAREIAA